MAEVVNTASAFVVQELAGQERTVVLIGRALPYRPFELGVKQRVNLTWYPGNPEATANVVGRTLAPTQIHGIWKDKYIADTVEAQSLIGLIGGFRPNQIAPMRVDGRAISDVRAAAALWESICEEGQLLEVTWDEQIRHGHLDALNLKWENRRDVSWSMSFQWISKGEPTVPAVFIAETSVQSTATALANSASALASFIDAPDFPADRNLLDKLRSLVSLVEDSVAGVADTASNLIRQAATPFDAVRRTIALATNIANLADTLVAQLESEVSAVLDISVPMPDMSFSKRLKASLFNKRSKTLARNLRAEALQRRASMSKQISRQLLGMVTARAGMDLREISNTFYKTPFEWRRLLEFNELTSSELVAGQLVMVPLISTSDQVARATGGCV